MEKIFDDGLRKGKAEGKLEEQKAIIKKLLLKGRSIEFITTELGFNVKLVEEIKKELE